MIRFRNRKELNSAMNNMYSVNDVTQGYNYWFWKLANICLDIFKYENLPDSLPQREIESNLIFTNHCVIFPKKAELVTAVTSIYGYDKYYTPTKYTYAQAVLGSKSNQSIKDHVIIYNSSLKDNVLNLPCDGSLLTFIQRYARQLADIESTINIYIVKMRLSSFPVATNDSVKASLLKFFDKLAIGERDVITDKPIIDSFRNIDISPKLTNDTLTDLLQCRDKILEMFYRDIGVKFRNNKRGNMTEKEVESDTQVLLISLDDLLNCRKEGIDELNSKYGLNVKVSINPRFDISKQETEEEVEENAN